MAGDPRKEISNMTANTSVAKRGRDRHDDSLDAYVATAGCKAASMK